MCENIEINLFLYKSRGYLYNNIRRSQIKDVLARWSSG